MPGSSELSDALNPNFYSSRSAVAINQPLYNQQYAGLSSTTGTASVVQPLVGNSQSLEQPQYIPHRSELEDAINPSSLHQASTAHSQPAGTVRGAQPEPMQFFRRIAATLASYKEALDSEKKRRLVWEQEHEAKFAQHQAELEVRLHALQKELDTLKMTINLSQDSPRTLAPQSLHNAPSSVSHSLDRANSTGNNGAEFVQGSSTSPMRENILNSRHAKRLRISPDVNDYPNMKLRTRQDSQPQSLQTAMRHHLLRVMDLEHDKELPDTHVEGEPLAVESPVRFVWDQTVRRSPHNTKMKTRIIADVLANRNLYPRVPEEDFTKAAVESALDQAFTTLRQKYASQRDGLVTVRAREREENKARRSRRVSRKKIKLNKRVMTRKEFPEYSKASFDAAFQMDCMSSEESSEDDISDGSGSEDDRHRPTFLRVRYLAWRSSRLHRLYHVLDEREEFDRSQKPKRGVGRKDRRMGLPKDGNPLPPKGVARWMVSKRWLKDVEANNPRVRDTVQELISEDSIVSWETLQALGDVSDVEEEHATSGDGMVAFTGQQYTDTLSQWMNDTVGYVQMYSEGSSRPNQ